MIRLRKLKAAEEYHKVGVMAMSVVLIISGKLLPGSLMLCYAEELIHVSFM